MQFNTNPVAVTTAIETRVSASDDFLHRSYSASPIETLNILPLPPHPFDSSYQSPAQIVPSAVSTPRTIGNLLQRSSISHAMGSESRDVYLAPSQKLESKSDTSLSPSRGYYDGNVATLVNKYDHPYLREADLLQQVVILCFWTNFCLLGAKIYISVISRSLSAIACTIDSLMDVLSGILILLTRRIIFNQNSFEFDRKYPAGRNLLEPVCSIVYATVMGSVSIQLCFFLIKKFFESSYIPPRIDMSIIFVLFFTILIKVILWVFCARLSKSRGDYLNVLSNDHGADVFTNTVAFVVIIFLFYWNNLRILDNAGALLIAAFASIAWIRSDKEQIRVLTGYKADPDFYKVLIAILDQFEEIVVDDIKAYHFGVKYIVEVDVVMDPSTPVKDYVRNEKMLREMILKLPMVHQCFVSTDYQKRNSSAYSRDNRISSAHAPRLRAPQRIHRENME